MEDIVQRHLNVKNMLTFNKVTDVPSCVTGEAMRTDSVLHLWEIVPSVLILTSYEEYSLELLNAMIKLWVAKNVTVHSLGDGFALWNQ